MMNQFFFTIKIWVSRTSKWADEELLPYLCIVFWLLVAKQLEINSTPSSTNRWFEILFSLKASQINKIRFYRQKFFFSWNQFRFSVKLLINHYIIDFTNFRRLTTHSVEIEAFFLPLKFYVKSNFSDLKMAKTGEFQLLKQHKFAKFRASKIAKMAVLRLKLSKLISRKIFRSRKFLPHCV